MEDPTMNKIIIEKLKEYEHLMIQKRIIEESLETIKQVILPELPADTKIATEDGTFTVERKQSWKFSDETVHAEEELKARKEREKQDGTAVAEPGEPYLVYRQAKKGE
jgi:hypothetical protein